MRSAALLTTILVALVALPGSATAQDDQAPPEGWKIRTDRAGADTSELFFVDMPPGWHVTSGPAAIYWHPEMRGGGDFRVEMDVYLFDPGRRREAFGFFVGGSDLDGPGQSYLYFLIREGGEFLVKTRDGRNTSTLVEWTAHPAIRSFADVAEGEASQLNHLAMHASGDEVIFMVNDREVTRIPRGDLEVEGTVGMRVNHALNLHISRFEVLPGVD